MKPHVKEYSDWFTVFDGKTNHTILKLAQPMRFRLNGENDFERCIVRKADAGSLEISCVLGLWTVCGNELELDRIEQEAYHYWFQYFTDGEYADHLSK